MINQIIEKYFNTWQSSYSEDKPVDIWKNPSKQEIRKELGNLIGARFIIDVKGKDIYFADGNYILHDWMWNFLKLNPKGLGKAIADGDAIIGSISDRGNASLSSNTSGLGQHKDADFKWVNKYISGFDKRLTDYVERWG